MAELQSGGSRQEISKLCRSEGRRSYWSSNYGNPGGLELVSRTRKVEAVTDQHNALHTV
jgi:hypothetical protein